MGSNGFEMRVYKIVGIDIYIISIRRIDLNWVLFAKSIF